MGGYSYDRDVYSSSSSSGWGSSSGYGSSYASKSLSASSLDSSMYPRDRKIKSKTKNPIIILLDVTGSNTDFAKIVYDKMPMFYGQIEQKGYLSDFDLAVCAVGDAYSDDYPLQVPEFAKGLEVDDWLKKLVLEGNGGGQRCETYELAAYCVSKNFEFEKDANPIIIFIGDEAPYQTIPKRLVTEYIDSSYKDGEDVNAKSMFHDLLKKYPNTFMFLNPYNGLHISTDIISEWEDFFSPAPKHLIKMQKDNEKAIVDLMLGVIAMVGETDLETYKIDMKDRGQTAKRIDTVGEMLGDVSTALVVTPTTTVAGLQSGSTNARSRTNKRL